MVLALGIDTGGTYTDGVVYDLERKAVLAKAKALTNYADLALGINECIAKLDLSSFKDVKFVSLSTTLATNAIVEGRGSEVGLILIGEEPISSLPVKNYAVIKGGHDLKGKPKEDLDLEGAKKALENFKDKVGAIAISGFCSIRNPEHELQIREMVKEVKDMPVVCAYQLTTALGFHERSVTAALNAKLIPIIDDLIKAVKRALLKTGIEAQLMVVKGDGSLMSEAVALQKPIETILSGPAASIIGAMTLTKISEGLVLDMGGTTTDIAILKNGIPRLNPEGAVVGGWLTRVQAADINTYGVGGDSYIRINKQGNLILGPQKVWPLAVVGYKYPYLMEELQTQWENRAKLRPSQLADCYILLKNFIPENLSDKERKILELLKSGPHSLLFIATSLGQNPYSLDLGSLIKQGILAKIAVTPTDILHCQGNHIIGNREIASLGVRILANSMGKDLEDFLELAMDLIVDKLALTLIKSILNFEGAPSEIKKELETNYLISKLLSPKAGEILSSIPKINLPIVAIGAPVEAYLPLVAHKLKAELIIPEHSEVANAIGAITGKVVVKGEILIKPSVEGYTLYSQWERREFVDLEEAKEYALQLGQRKAILSAKESGAIDYKIEERVKDLYTNGVQGTYMETRIEVLVIGSPRW